MQNVQSDSVVQTLYYRVCTTINICKSIKPPFIRLVTPVIKCKHIEFGGAICTELLTPKGWSSTYSMEMVIIQIVALLEKVHNVHSQSIIEG